MRLWPRPTTLGPSPAMPAADTTTAPTGTSPSRAARRASARASFMNRWSSCRLALRSFTGAAPRDVPARPGPLEVEAADAAVDVADLAAQDQTLANARPHRVEVDL